MSACHPKQALPVSVFGPTIHLVVRTLSLLALLVISIMPRPAQAARALRSVDVIGTALRVTFADGGVVEGRALEGAILDLRLAGQTQIKRVRLDRIISDPARPGSELLLYRITALPMESGAQDHGLCEKDKDGEQWAFPLKGQWDPNGRRLSDHGLTLACASGGAIGKCVRWGYAPWQKSASGVSLAPYHAACVNMVRANYCGDQGWTRDGMAIDYFDTAGINLPDDKQTAQLGLSFEAAWGPDGAICVAHTRVPENVTIDGLATRCPWMRSRLGAGNCMEADAIAGHYGRALMFDRSR